MPLLCRTSRAVKTVMTRSASLPKRRGRGSARCGNATPRPAHRTGAIRCWYGVPAHMT